MDEFCSQSTGSMGRSSRLYNRRHSKWGVTVNIDSWQKIRELTEKYGPPKSDGRKGNGLTFEKSNTSVWVGLRPSGSISYIEYSESSSEHSILMLSRPHLDGPAVESFHDNGKVHCRYHYKSSLLHRPTDLGPAYVNYGYDGALMGCSYYHMGISQQKVDAISLRS